MNTTSALASLFDDQALQRQGRSSSHAPSVEFLLGIDMSYRKKAASGLLPKVAPTQLNRSGIAWLPLMRQQFGDWRCKVHFSNTMRANRLGKTSDWVIITYKDKFGVTGRATVVTESQGAGKGQRVVRGREYELDLA